MSNRKLKPKITLDNIPVLERTGGRRKPKKNPDRPLHGIADLASVDRVIASLTNYKTSLGAEVRDRVEAIFLAEGLQRGERPGNFFGVEFETIDGTPHRRAASCELRKNIYPLTAEAAQDAKDAGLPLVERIDVHETYVINPKYAKDRVVMERMVMALNKTRGLPADLLNKQDGVSKTYCTDLTLPAIFKLPRKTAERLLPIYSTLALGKYEYQGDSDFGYAIESRDLDHAWKRVCKLIGRT